MWFYKLNALLEQWFLNYCVFSKEVCNTLASGGTCKQELWDTFSSHKNCSHKVLILLPKESELCWRPVCGASRVCLGLWLLEKDPSCAPWSYLLSRKIPALNLLVFLSYCCRESCLWSSNVQCSLLNGWFLYSYFGLFFTLAFWKWVPVGILHRGTESSAL